MSARFQGLLSRAAILSCFACLSLDCLAQGACPDDEVAAHVREQLQIYGPKSVDLEYFAFIYSVNGEISSAVSRGSQCPGTDSCAINTRFAAQRIPRGSKVLGEWHTHPHSGSRQLSIEDIRGAKNNARIRCYTAYYSAPDGEIYSWDPRSTSVPTAMNTRMLVGRYELRGGKEHELYSAAAAVALRGR